MPKIVVPGPLRVHTAGQKEITVAGETVGQALAQLVARHPDLEPQIFTTEGALRPSLHLFLGEREVQSLQGSETPLAAGDRLIMVLPIGGGGGFA